MKYSWNLLKGKITSSDVAKRLIKGSFWSFTGTALGKLIVLLSGVICARILGKAAYGEFGMVRSTINMFVVVGFAGLGLTASKYISEYKAHQKERIGSIYLLTNGFAYLTGILVTLLVLFLAPFLAVNTLHAPNLITPIRIGAILLFVTVLDGAQNGTLSGFEDFKSIAINTFLGSVAESLLMILGGFLYGVTGAILGYGMGYIVLFVGNQFAIRRNFKQYGIAVNRTSFNQKDLRLLYTFSLPAMLSSLMITPIYWIVRSLLVRANGFSELAAYEAADQWKVIILFIPSAVSQVVLPILSSMVKTETKNFWKILNINMLLNGGIALCFSLLICLFSSPIMKMYGNDYSDPWPLIILALSTVLTAISGVIGLSISSRAKMWTGFGFNFLWGLMVVAFSFLFLKQGLGATGVALAILCSYAVHATLQLTYLKASIKL